MSSDTQQRFLRMALNAGALKFGEFELKSGRISPYFFNAGAFTRGSELAELARCYAETIQREAPPFDIVFGPAYKGIPLAALVARELAVTHQRDVAYAFDRKEAKHHGEGGELVGAPVAGQRVLMVDDVISAGTAARLAIDKLRAADAQIVALTIALDRQERGPSGGDSAAASLHHDTDVQVISVAGLEDLLAVTADHADCQAHHEAVRAYRQRFGVQPG